MHNHALGIELYTPITLCEKPIKDVVVLKVECSDEEAERLTRNVLIGNSTNSGTFPVFVSDYLGNPNNPQVIMLNLDNIKVVWKID